MSKWNRKTILSKYNSKHGTAYDTLPELIEAVSPVKTIDSSGITTSLSELHEKADDRLYDYLSDKGLVLSEENKKALSELNGMLLAQLEGAHIGRFQVDLPAGFGKTSAVKCLISTLYEYELPYSLGISVERIDQVDELYEELVEEFKIPKEKIKRVHSGKLVPQTQKYYASLKDAQFLIFTQARLKAAQFIDTYYKYKRPDTGELVMRDLLIWDESLISSLSFSERYTTVLKMVSNAITDLDNALCGPHQRTARIQVLEFLRQFQTFLHKQKAKDFTAPEILEVTVSRLKSVSPADINKLPLEDDRVKDILRIYSGDKPSNFLRASKDGLNKKVVLTFKEILPKELENIMVLDASASFRVATRLDGSFTFVDIPRDVSYPGSKAYLYDYNSGATDIAGAFKGVRAKRRSIGRNEYEEFAIAVAEAIYGSDPDASVLLSSYKRTISDLERAIHNHLRSSPNVDANKGTLKCITYGRETASNEYRDCAYIIEVGTFQTPDYAIDNLIAGQLGDDKYDMDRLEELRPIVSLTEMTHTFYQRTFRVRIRLGDPEQPIVLHGFSKFREEIREVLTPVMPEFEWDFSEPDGLFSDALAQRETLRKAIRADEGLLSKLERRFLYDYADLLVREGLMSIREIARVLKLPVDTVKSNFKQWENKKGSEPYSLIAKDDTTRPAKYSVSDEVRLRATQDRYGSGSPFGENEPEEASV